MEIIKKYFPNLDPKQFQQFQQLAGLYREWNQKINVISRKDIDNLLVHHLLHSLAIAKFVQFTPFAEVLDLGTGGGLPGIPLAILFPRTSFTLIDGTRKKIKVVDEIKNELELKNIDAQQIRGEELKSKFDFVVCRGVASIEKLNLWSNRLIKNHAQHALPNGLITLKGGNLRSEIKELPKGTYYEKVSISDFFEESFFKEKYLIYIQK